MLIVFSYVFLLEIIKNSYKVVFHIIEISLLVFVSYKYSDAAILLLNMELLEVFLKKFKYRLIGVIFTISSLVLVNRENLM